MVAWEDNGHGDCIPIIYCDCCGQQADTVKNGKLISCVEVDGKWYCSDCIDAQTYDDLRP